MIGWYCYCCADDVAVGDRHDVAAAFLAMTSFHVVIGCRGNVPASDWPEETSWSDNQARGGQVREGKEGEGSYLRGMMDRLFVHFHRKRV